MQRLFENTSINIRINIFKIFLRTAFLKEN